MLSACRQQKVNMDILRGNNSIAGAGSSALRKTMPQARCNAPVSILLVGLAIILPVTKVVAQSVIGGYTITTVAGNGTAGSSGNGSLATSAELSNPLRTAFDAAGNMYIADTGNNVIRMVSASTGNISIVAGGGATTTAGTACPTGPGTATDAFGDGCIPTAAVLAKPEGMAFDGQGNLYIADRADYAVRKVTNPSTGTGVITNLAGRIGTGPGSCATSATAANLANGSSAPVIEMTEIAFDTAGNLYMGMNGSVCQGLTKIANTSGNPLIFTPGALSLMVSAYNCTNVNAATGLTIGSVNTCSIDGVFADKLGNLYVTIPNNSGEMVLKLTNVAGLGSNAIITVIAGINGTPGFTGDGGPATAAELKPESAIADAAGNVYIADAVNNRVREVLASSGTIITIAGGGSTYADGVEALNTNLDVDEAVSIDASGNLYIADATHNRIRKLTPSFPNLAGAGSVAVGSSSTATLYLETTKPTTLNALTVTSPSGDFTLGTQTGCTINGSTSNAMGLICTVPVTFKPKYVGQRTEPLSITDGSSVVDTFTLSGVGTGPVAGFISPPIASITAATGVVKAPAGSAVDTDGNLYVADTGNNVVREITTAGVVSIVAGGGTSPATCTGSTDAFGDGCTATAATLNGPLGVAVDSLGDIYIADTGDNSIREVTGGIINTIAGSTKGTAGSGGDGGAATSALLTKPAGLVADVYGDLYLADSGNNVVRKVVGGVISTIAGGATTITAGSSCIGGTAIDTIGDGCLATAAKLSNPSGLALDGSRNLYIADTGNDVIRKVTPSPGTGILSIGTGIISLVAGNAGIGGYGGDGGAPTSALLNAPSGITIDAAGDLYIADTGNDVVRAIYGSGLISTLAGTSGVATYSGDGGGAASATLNAPASLSLGGADILYVVDTGNNAVRTLSFTTSPTVPLAFPDTAINTTSNPLSTIVQNLGNTTLTFTGLTFPTYFAQQPTTVTTGVNCATAASSGYVNTLASGADCYIATDFKPTVIATQSGNITVTDNTNNVATSSQSIPVSGKGVAALGVITASVPTVTYGSPSSMTITVSGTGTYPTPTGTITYQVDSGATSVAETLTAGVYGPVSLGSLTAGNHTLVVTYSGDATYGRSTATFTFVVTGLGVTLGVTEAPTSPTWGTSVTATVTLTATATNTPLSAQVTYILDAGTVPFPLTVTNGTATIALGNSLSVACHKLVVNYAGSTQYGAVSQTLNFCVTAAVTATTLSGPSTLYPGNPATFTATVTSATGASTAGGTVLFEVGTVVICTSTVSSSGTATCTYTFGTAPLSAYGNYAVTANYQASTDFLASSSASLAVLFSPADFTIIPETPAAGATAAAPTSSITVASGTGTNIWVEVVGNDYLGTTAAPGYQGTVNLSCSGLPAYVGCTINPTSVTLTSASYPSSFPTVTTFTIGALTTSQNRVGPYGRWTDTGVMEASLFFPALMLAGWIGKKRRYVPAKMRGGMMLLALALSLCGFAGISGCGYNPVGVAPGTYQINIVGTDTTNNIVRSATLSVTVTQ